MNTSAYSNDNVKITESSNKNLTGKYRIFKDNTIIYSNSNLSGTKYYYLPNTTVKVLEDLGNINKIYVIATGRIGYVAENTHK